MDEKKEAAEMEVAVSGIECKWITTEQGPAPGEARRNMQFRTHLTWNEMAVLEPR